jgi:dTDP-D-glucose 4,6-dehydratase
MLDVSRARERFGFEARTPFEEGLRRTVAWYATSRSGTTRRTSGQRPAAEGDEAEEMLPEKRAA